MPSPPPNPAWIAAVVAALGIVVTVIGWFVVNSLSKKREIRRDEKMRQQLLSDAKAMRKTEFLAFIGQVEKRADTLHITEFGEFFAGVLPNITHWTILIERDFLENERIRFKETAKTICELTPTDIHNTANKNEILGRLKKMADFVKNASP